MQILYDWIRTIIIFIMFATILDFLLPRSDFQKYVKMVVSLILLLIMISPLFKILKVDIEDALANFNQSQAVEVSSMKNLIEKKKIDIQREQHAYTLNQMAVLLKNLVEEELKGEYKAAISDIQISMKKGKEYSMQSEDIDFLNVTIIESADKFSITPVESVSINTSDMPKTEVDERQMEHITDLLAKEWQIDKTKININLEERS